MWLTDAITQVRLTGAKGWGPVPDPNLTGLLCVSLAATVTASHRLHILQCERESHTVDLALPTGAQQPARPHQCCDTMCLSNLIPHSSS